MYVQLNQRLQKLLIVILYNLQYYVTIVVGHCIETWLD